ncbi:MAG: DEAD/DEAH box helicase family protein [Dissulfurimicrobium sp.]|uniref:flagellar biosynthesis protein FlhF n=1 Tax=Dissulfurimicrobium sp. TaxID=2022436 RepID=UPI00404A2332
MNIKKFLAPNIAEALAMVKAEFGDDAVIVQTNRRRRRDEATGVIQNMVEVTVAADLASRMDAAPFRPSGYMSEEKTLHTATWPRKARFNRSSPLLIIHDVLTEFGIEHELQQRLAAQFLQKNAENKEITHDLVYYWLKDLVSNRIKIADRAEDAASMLNIAFVGPTGTGKTTTIAKLAARLKFQKNMNGVLATVDTYKLGAAEQLERYARLMDIYFEALRDPRELNSLIERHRNADFILIDTTGRGAKDPRYREELSLIFNSSPSIRGYAILCATSKAEDLTTQIELYSMFPVTSWVITKTDETTSYGPLCTPIIRDQLPISYITNGQKVPEDIMEATKDKLINLLFGKRGHLGISCANDSNGLDSGLKS